MYQFYRQFTDKSLRKERFTVKCGEWKSFFECDMLCTTKTCDFTLFTSAFSFFLRLFLVNLRSRSFIIRSHEKGMIDPEMHSLMNKLLSQRTLTTLLARDHLENWDIFHDLAYLVAGNEVYLEHLPHESDKIFRKCHYLLYTLVYDFLGKFKLSWRCSSNYFSWFLGDDAWDIIRHRQPGFPSHRKIS